ncbi:MAG: hypothetical protein AAF514_17265 [Verrucomicrobiota bacterium]
MKVLFAPDFSRENAYQPLLAEALEEAGLTVRFLSDYKRVFPLARSLPAAEADLVHIHWPEAYFLNRGDRWDLMRKLRYPLDLSLATRKTPSVLTAHNLLPHNRADEALVRRNIESTVRQSRKIFLHSAGAESTFIEQFPVAAGKTTCIPFGESSKPLGRLLTKQQAAGCLDRTLTATPLCLMIGTLSRYKGIAEAIEFWGQAPRPARLVIVGRVIKAAHIEELKALARPLPNVELHTSDWVSDEEMVAWMSLADCILFNHERVFSSGASATVRSLGIPQLIPERLRTVDLDEPHPHVIRFSSLNEDFNPMLKKALSRSSDYDLAASWREKTSWERVAEETIEAYEEALALTN